MAASDQTDVVSWSISFHGNLGKMAHNLYFALMLCLISMFKQLRSISVQTYADPVTCLDDGLSFLPANISCIECGSNMRPSISGE